MYLLGLILIVVVFLWFEYRDLVEVHVVAEVNGYHLRSNAGNTHYFLVVDICGNEVEMQLNKDVFSKFVDITAVSGSGFRYVVHGKIFNTKIPVSFKRTNLTKRIIQIRPKLE